MSLTALSPARGVAGAMAGAALLLVLAAWTDTGSAGRIAIAGGVVLVGLAAVSWPLELLVIVYPFLWPLFDVPLGLSAGSSFSPEKALSVVVGALVVAGIALRRVVVPPFPVPLIIAAVAVVASQIASAIAAETAQLGPVLQLAQKMVLAWLAFVAASDAARSALLVRLLIAGSTVTAIAAASLVWIGGDVDAVLLIRSQDLVNLDYRSNQLWLAAARTSHLGQFAVWLALALTAASMKSTRVRWSILAALLLVGEVFSFRRQVIVATLLIVPILVVSRRLRVRAQAGGVLVVAAVAFLFFILPASPLWQSRLSEETDRAIRNYEDPRVELAVASYEAWLERPVFGSGPGSFQEVMFQHRASFQLMTGENIAPHNSFTAFAVESGLVGLSAIVVLLGMIAVQLYRVDRLNVETEAGIMLRFWPLIFIQTMVWAMLGHGLFLNLTWFLLGMLLGLAALVRRQNEGFAE